MKRLIALSACALFACNDAAQTDIARGNVLASRGDSKGAADAYQAAAKELPDKAQPRELLGHLLADQKRYSEARAAYEDALRVESNAVEARLGLARIASETGDLSTAISQLSSVLQQQPSNLYALLSRASLESKRGTPADVEQAIVDTAKAMAIDAKSEPVLYARGDAFLAARRFDDAKTAFELLEKNHPRSQLGWYGVARVAAAQGNRDAAVQALRRARELTAKAKQSWNTSEIEADPAFAALRSEPGFIAAVER